MQGVLWDKSTRYLPCTQFYGELRYCDCLDKMDYLIKRLSIKLRSIDLSPVYNKGLRIKWKIEHLKDFRRLHRFLNKNKKKDLDKSKLLFMPRMSHYETPLYLNY